MCFLQLVLSCVTSHCSFVANAGFLVGKRCSYVNQMNTPYVDKNSISHEYSVGYMSFLFHNVFCLCSCLTWYTEKKPCWMLSRVWLVTDARSCSPPCWRSSWSTCSPSLATFSSKTTSSWRWIVFPTQLWVRAHLMAFNNSDMTADCRFLILKRRESLYNFWSYSLENGASLAGEFLSAGMCPGGTDENCTTEALQEGEDNSNTGFYLIKFQYFNN